MIKTKSMETFVADVGISDIPSSFTDLIITIASAYHGHFISPYSKSESFCNQNGSAHQYIGHNLDIEIDMVDYKLNKNERVEAQNRNLGTNLVSSVC